MTYNRPICNCPDAVNAASKNLFSNYNSDSFDRTWKTRTNSSTGVTSNFTGIRERGFYCKHEMAVIRDRDEIDQAFPNGIPYEPPIEQLGEIGTEYSQEFSSDNLQSDLLFLQPISEII